MTENLPQTLQERLKEMAELQNARVEPSSGTIVATADGFEIPDIGIAPSPMNVVVLDWRSINAYYDRPFKKGEIHPPACFAIGTVVDHNSSALEPVPNSPVPQAESCAVCPHNEFDSDPRGGKACKNSKRLAILPVDAWQKEDVPIMFVNISPIGLKHFAKYAKAFKSSKVSVPYCAAITRLSIIEAGTGFATKVDLEFVNQDQNAVLYFLNRVSEASSMLDRLPDFSKYEAPKKK